MKLQTTITALFMLGALFVLAPFTVSAQVIVQEGIKQMSKGDQNCFYIDLPSDNTKLAMDVWKDFMKDYKSGKTKTDRKTKEIFTDNAVVKEMSDNTVDVYARIDGSTLTAWFDLGGAYLSSAQHPKRYPTVEKMLNSYYFKFSKEIAKADLERRESELKSLEKELKKLEDQQKDLHETIEKAKETIAKAEADIDANREMQGSKKTEIEIKAAEVNAAKKHFESIGGKN